MRAAIERPADTNREYQFTYPGKRFTDGLLLHVIRDGRSPWIGHFSPGENEFFAAAGYSGGRQLIVVSGGDAYWVDIERPDRFICFESSWVAGLVHRSPRRLTV